MFYLISIPYMITFSKIELYYLLLTFQFQNFKKIEFSFMANVTHYGFPIDKSKLSFLKNYKYCLPIKFVAFPMFLHIWASHKQSFY